MLRKGILTLLFAAVSLTAVSTDACADDRSNGQGGLIGWFKRNKVTSGSSRFARPRMSRTDAARSSAGVRHAVVADATKEAAQTQPRHQPARVATQTAQQTTVELPPLPEPPAEPTTRFVAADENDTGNVDAIQVVTPPDSVNTSEARPIQMPNVVPNANPLSGPQYFSATTGHQSVPVPVHPGNNWQEYVGPGPIHTAAPAPVPVPDAHSGSVAGHATYHGNQQFGQYPQTGAALYPSPVPGIPQHVGGTAITNQALYPHEMLYPHEYNATYGPYYYRVNGGWMVTPFGVWSKERWKVEGTRVNVKYRSSISPFSGFHPPLIK